MKFVERLNSLFATIKQKRRISLQSDDREVWRAEISSMSFVAIGVAILTILFAVVLLVVAYTPLLDLMPGYRTNAGRSREALFHNIARVDSLERKLNDMLSYNESRILVVSGKTPAMQSVKNDTVQRAKTIVEPSEADSLLRKKIENDERYRLNTTKPTQSSQSALNAVSPMYGLVAERFNSENLRGMRISGAKDAQVSAIADGVVMLSEWSPERGHTIVIQHKNNIVSIYRNLANSLVTTGALVKSAQAIGSAAGSKDAEGSMLEFELWSEAKAVNPELYIIF